MSRIRKRSNSETNDDDEKRPLLSSCNPYDDTKITQSSSKVGFYQVYALGLFLLTYLLNKLDRYLLAITIKPMAQDVHFGDKGCMPHTNVSDEELGDIQCNATKMDACLHTSLGNGSEKASICKWDYNGQGIEYQLVAGPVFIVINTFAGVFISVVADRYNRKMMLAGCLIFWSTMTVLTGLIEKYWQLVILRFALGFGEAGCTPFVASMLMDLYPDNLRGTALGVYNWGIYMGYSMSYAFGNLVTQANINGQGWRWAFFLSGIPGIGLGVLIFLSVREPERKHIRSDSTTELMLNSKNWLQRLKVILKPFLAPSLILAVSAGSVRNAAGYVFAYNAQPYFISIGQTKEQIAQYMGWIPLVGGSLGVVVGGFISDKVVRGRGLYARVFIIITSLLIASPFAAGTLFLNPPWAYISQIPCYLFGEMWIGITLAIVVELVPIATRMSAVAVYLFIIGNVGGNMPLLVPPIQRTFENDDYTKSQGLRGALYILYASLYVLAAILFIPAMFAIKRDQARVEHEVYTIYENVCKCRKNEEHSDKQMAIAGNGKTVGNGANTGNCVNACKCTNAGNYSTVTDEL